MLCKLGIKATLQRNAEGVAPDENAVKSTKNHNIQPLSYYSTTVTKDDAAAAVVASDTTETSPEEKLLFYETVKFSHDPFAALNAANDDTPRRRPRSNTIADLSKTTTSSHSNGGAKETWVSSSSMTPNFDLTGQKKSCGTKRRAVNFNPTVSVMSIPSRDAYSPQVRSCLWTPRSEISAQASRNIHEFVSEGWNWRLCVEDDGMYVRTGRELIHPVHFVSCFSHGAYDHPNTSCQED